MFSKKPNRCPNTACNWSQARQNTWKWCHHSLLFPFDWLRKWRGFINQSQSESMQVALTAGKRMRAKQDLNFWGQDEANPVFWLAAHLASTARGLLRWSNKKRFSFWPCNKSFMDQAWSVKIASYWPVSFVRFYLLTLISSRFIKRQKRNLANVHPFDLTIGRSHK